MCNILCDNCRSGYDDHGYAGCSIPKPTKSPISWAGGKFYLAGKITPLFPKHAVYVEPFGGAMHVLFKKQPSENEVYNDIDSRLVNFWRVVKDPHKLNQLLEMLEYVLYSRQLFNECLENMSNGSDVQRAFCFYIVNRQCFGGKMGTWGTEKRLKNSQIYKLQKYDLKLTRAHQRLRGVQIENDDFEKVIKRFDTPNTLFYCDPPYIFNHMRGDSRKYKFEMDTDAHIRLVDTLKNIKGKFILSGYENALYNVFRRVELGEANMNICKTTDGQKRKKKTEFVWMNF